MSESQSGFSDDRLFLTLVTDLVTQAWVALGKIKHPASDKIERNVPAAGLIIDMLDMLSRKTAGNRTEVEDRLLLDSLQQLKLNYVAEADQPEASADQESEEAPPEEESGEAPEETAAEEEQAEKANSTKAARPAKDSSKSSKKKKS